MIVEVRVHINALSDDGEIEQTLGLGAEDVVLEVKTELIVHAELSYGGNNSCILMRLIRLLSKIHIYLSPHDFAQTELVI